MIMLSPEERDRFAAWLEQDAAGTLGLVEQMAKMPSGTLDLLMKRKRTEATAQQIVAKLLRSIEET